MTKPIPSFEYAAAKTPRTGSFAGDSPAPSGSAESLVQTGQNPRQHRGVFCAAPGNCGSQQRSCYWPEARDRGARRAVRPGEDSLRSPRGRSGTLSSGCRATNNSLVQRRSASSNGGMNPPSSSSGFSRMRRSRRCWWTSVLHGLSPWRSEARAASNSKESRVSTSSPRSEKCTKRILAVR